MPSSTIQSLIDEGVLVLYHDYRAGHMQDLSGNGNHGTATGMNWQDNGLRALSAGGRVDVADSASLQIAPEGTVFYGGFIANQASNIFLISKRDAGGTNYEMYINASQVVLYDGTNHRARAGTFVTGSCCLAINFADGEAGEIFVNGSSVGTLTGASAISTDNAPLKICNNFASGTGDNRQNTTRVIIIVNRKLTTAEHAALYSEIHAMRWPSKPQARDPGNYEWVSGWTAKEIANVAPVNYVPGTPFIVDTGAYKVAVETISGKRYKVLECTNDGIVRLNMNETHDGKTDNAYGTWEFWMAKGGAAMVPRVYFIANTAAGATGYHLYSNGAANNIILYETGVGAKFTSANDTIVPGVWNLYKITRGAAGEFTVYLNGVAVVASTGTNPVTDNTTTTSEYMVFDFDAGDKIVLGDVRGEDGLQKHHSVI